MGGPMIDPSLCVMALALPLVAPLVYYTYIRLQLRHAKKARHLHPLHLKAAFFCAGSSAFLIFLGFVFPVLGVLLYTILGIAFGGGALYHWSEHRWYLDLSKRVS